MKKEEGEGEEEEDKEKEERKVGEKMGEEKMKMW